MALYQGLLLVHSGASSASGMILFVRTPNFGNRVLYTLNQVEIENWLVSLRSNGKSKAQLSNQTKNHTLYTFRIVLREAKREGLIPFNCLEQVEPLAILPKARDTFSQKEQKLSITIVI